MRQIYFSGSALFVYPDCEKQYWFKNTLKLSEWFGAIFEM